MYQKFAVTIHLDNLLMHNCILADPLHPLKKEMSAISSKRKKADEDHAAMAYIEYKSSLYLNAKNEPVIPSRMFEAFLLDSARAHKEGKLAAAGIFVDQDATFTYEGGPLTVKELLASPEHRYVAPVVVQRARLMRTRPIFKDVKSTILLSANEEVCDETHLSRWLQTGLNTVGMGDYRPRFGRGKLINLEKI